jgi:hypothetical protein
MLPPREGPIEVGVIGDWEKNLGTAKVEPISTVEGVRTSGPGCAAGKPLASRNSVLLF